MGTSLTGRRMQVGLAKIAILSQYLAPLHAVNAAGCYQHGAARPWQVVILITGSKQRSLLMAKDDDEMFITRSLDVTPKTTEQCI